MLKLTFMENFAPWIPELFHVAANFNSSIEHFMALTIAEVAYTYQQELKFRCNMVKYD